MRLKNKNLIFEKTVSEKEVYSKEKENTSKYEDKASPKAVEMEEKSNKEEENTDLKRRTRTREAGMRFLQRMKRQMWGLRMLRILTRVWRWKS